MPDVAFVLLTVGSFGVGFVMRPLGGIVIGAYADRAGRKKAMTLTITASIGVAVHAGDGRTLDDTLRAADVALYRAKAHGRDQVAVASRQTDSTS